MQLRHAIQIAFVVPAAFIYVGEIHQALKYADRENVEESMPNGLTSQQLQPSFKEYQPSEIEAHMSENAVALGYNKKGNKSSGSGCEIWKDEDSPIKEQLQTFRVELDTYKNLLNSFMQKSPVPDVRDSLSDGNDINDICSTLEVNPDGLKDIFQSGQLSCLNNTEGKCELLEPLLPPMRHPGICSNFRRHLMDMTFLVHDFASICRKLKKHSRIVLVDMGASLEFHGNSLSPAVYLANTFRQFGMPFDHIYAYEITEAPPSNVFEKVPEHLMSAFHWINVGVDPSPESKLNPLRMLKQNYREDDLIIVKLDIDTANVENQLVQQVRNDTDYIGLIDHFYFEHHIYLQELNSRFASTGSDRASVQESLELFSALREKGIASHFWV